MKKQMGRLVLWIILALWVGWIIGYRFRMAEHPTPPPQMTPRLALAYVQLTTDLRLCLNYDRDLAWKMSKEQLPGVGREATYEGDGIWNVRIGEARFILNENGLRVGPY